MSLLENSIVFLIILALPLGLWQEVILFTHFIKWLLQM